MPRTQRPRPARQPPPLAAAERPHPALPQRGREWRLPTADAIDRVAHADDPRAQSGTARQAVPARAVIASVSRNDRAHWRPANAIRSFGISRALVANAEVSS